MSVYMMQPVYGFPPGKTVWPASALAVTLSRKSVQCSLKLEPTPQNVAPNHQRLGPSQLRKFKKVFGYSGL